MFFRSVRFFVVAVIALVVAGCSPVDGESRVGPPIEELFAAEQQGYDRLPAGVPALLTVVPASSRYAGMVGAHHFYLARGVVAPYCVVVIDVYGAQLFQQCGGDSFGGEYWDGLKFEFGAVWAKKAASVRGSFSLTDHLDVALKDVSPRDFPAIVELLDREQVSGDVAPGFQDHDFYVTESMRLIAADGENRYFFVLSTWPGMEICLVEQRADIGSGSCGWGDVVLHASFDSVTHFSAAGFVGEPPDGWRQLSDLVRVGELEFDGGWPLYPGARD